MLTTLDTVYIYIYIYANLTNRINICAGNLYFTENYMTYLSMLRWKAWRSNLCFVNYIRDG